MFHLRRESLERVSDSGLNGVLVAFCYPATGIKEICQTEVFRPVCAKDEVIVIETAQYGRLQLGGWAKLLLATVFS